MIRLSHGTAGGILAVGAVIIGALTMTPAGAGPDNIAFPEGYREHFTHYATVNRDDDRKQVVKLFANPSALSSAKDGAPLESGSVLAMEVYKAKLDASETPIVGEDGLFIPDQLTAVAVMESKDGWGEDYPEEWRNGSWEYALFNEDGSRIERDVQPCFECHKPLKEADYLFSIDRLSAAAGG